MSAKQAAKKQPVLGVSGLIKKFGDHTVLSDVGFAVKAGRAAVLVGPNGSGKTTVLRCVTGADPADEGEVRIGGELYDDRSPSIRSAMAVVMDDIDFFPDLTVVEHLDLYARAHRVPDADGLVDDVMREVGLFAQAAQLPGSLSSGQRRRLALAGAFVRPRRLLILDEPEQRLDEEGTDWLIERLKREKREGLAVLFASHSTRLVEALADDVITLGGES
ncbi:ATP-binding cassette domain-containing protein [Nocardioides sp. Bht2]|uniref:ABC transporter ATP-binding protein n=1 Tax=Nocardioides sp. Bht2 TaxID=3392297 RepID=UPI0039B3BA8F